MLDSSYYEWRRQAESRGIGADTLLKYYEDDTKHFFRVKINGNDRIYPLFTTSAWATPQQGFDGILHDLDDEAYINHDDHGIHLRTNVLGFLEDDPNPTSEDYVYNEPVYFAHVSPSAGSITPVESDMYTLISEEGLLLDELYRLIYYQGRDTINSEEVAALPDLKLPDREARYKNFSRMVKKPLSMETSMLVVFNTDPEYRALFSHRAEKNIALPDWWSLSPMGTYKEQDTPQPNLQAVHLREYAEEVFNHTSSVNPLDTRGVHDVLNLYENNDAHLDHLGFSIDPLRATIQLSGLLLVEDPDYYQTHINGKLDPTEEHTEFDLVPLTHQRLTDRLHDITPIHSYTALMGLRRLNTEYGLDIHPDIDITNPVARDY